MDTLIKPGRSVSVCPEVERNISLRPPVSLLPARCPPAFVELFLGGFWVLIR